ncbi:hypothetical protein [Pseudoalteromonas sp. TB41]|nr:hypothetical protein [Pseudoalteromonas sp. TB41]
MSKSCEYAHCENEAELIDSMGSFVCAECMNREVEDGSAEFEDFESIGDL